MEGVLHGRNQLGASASVAPSPQRPDWHRASPADGGARGPGRDRCGRSVLDAVGDKRKRSGTGTEILSKQHGNAEARTGSRWLLVEFVGGRPTVAGNHQAQWAERHGGRRQRRNGGCRNDLPRDIRIATNVTNPDGTRGIGTKLAAGVVHDTVLRDGRTYEGHATILGKPYLTVYEPIRNAQAATIGVLFVGVDLPWYRRAGGGLADGSER